MVRPFHIMSDPFPTPVARERTAFDDDNAIMASAGPLEGTTLAPVRYTFDDGSKFAGGFGVTKLLRADYWTLRARSAQLFETNLYARGLIRRLATNVVNTGLYLEATPEEEILGFQEDELADWSDEVEDRFTLWCDNARLCDQNERLTFGELQSYAYTEALIEGDVLCVLRQDPRTQLPRVQLIKGSSVQSPWGVAEIAPNKIQHGVEIDSSGRHVAYYVQQEDGTSKRLPAFGEKSGRRLAWLMYASDKRLDDVRGKPILSLILQSLQEVDRYRDSTQRKAAVLSLIAGYVEKTQDKPGSRPISGGAVRRGLEVQQSADGNHLVRTSEHLPGMFIEELNVGEKIQAFQTQGTTESFGLFEEAIIQAVAWANEIPPEILMLSFGSNYSASQAAINEFKMFLNKVRTLLGNAFCRPIYIEWLLAEVAARRIQAEGLLDSWRDFSLYDRFASWVSCDWSGQIKPAVDLSKLVGGYAAMAEKGYIDHDRAARELTGTSHRKNMRKLKRQNQLIADANAPLAALEAAAKTPPGGSDAGKKDAGGQGEDGKDDQIEGRGGYPRRRRSELRAV